MCKSEYVLVLLQTFVINMEIDAWKNKILDDVNIRLKSLREKLEILVPEIPDYIKRKGSDSFRYHAYEFCENVQEIQNSMSEVLIACETFKRVPGRTELENDTLDSLFLMMYSRINLGEMYYTQAFNAWFYARTYALKDEYTAARSKQKHKNKKCKNVKNVKLKND